MTSTDADAPNHLAYSPGLDGLRALAIVGACVCWGADNNLTQAVSSADPVFLASLKGLAAGVVNVTAALALGAAVPSAPFVASGLAIGFVGYGLSLVCFILALRHVGTARTGAYFAMAPFIGCVASFLLLHDSLTARFAIAAALMGVGVWIHVTERHEHPHTHEPMTHNHQHTHDEHHGHTHGSDVPDVAPGVPHTHEHTHAATAHSHAHAPDIHHRHGH